MITYHSIQELAKLAADRDVSISRIVLEDQADCLGKSEQEILRHMKENLDVMRAAAKGGISNRNRSFSGLSGGDGANLLEYADSGRALSGELGIKALTYAIAVSEHNAAMGKIVAAPTAGSCGILPGVLLSMMELRGVGEEAALMALVTAGAVGLVIATEASISGAEGGCQAECGSAAAMAAAALVEMSGGSPEMAVNACAIALKNQMGLVCDPVAGLVEAPCVKRNGGGVACAIAAADMALSGMKSVIPADEVVAAMREVGDALPGSLRETAQGGLAATPTAQSITERIYGGKKQ
jgi:L-serine dehydratase